MRERDRYKITDKMWDQIEHWVGDSKVDLNFIWDFTGVGDFLRVVDSLSDAYIQFCDGELKSKKEIPKDTRTVLTNVLPINDVVAYKKSYNISYYKGREKEVKEFINDVKQKIKSGQLNSLLTDTFFIENYLNRSSVIIGAHEQSDGLEKIKIELRDN